jgi:riboflavin biosynthesis pyrimidine reductase
LADVVLVGAGTVRAEGYGPVRVPQDRQRQREAAGRLPVPPLAIVTRSLDLDLAAPLFTAAAVRPLVLTAGSAPQDRRRAAAEVADVVVAGDDRVDMVDAVGALVDRGLTRILSEGGPHLLAELFAADLVDELCLAVAPLVTCGHQLRITSGPALATPAGLRVASVLEEDGFLFLRYGRG